MKRPAKHLQPVGTAILVALIAAVSLGFLTSVRALPNASVDVILDVLPSLTVSGERALTFGSVLAGAQKSIRAADPTAGRWRIEGSPGLQIRMAFRLPESVVSETGNECPVRFSDRDVNLADTPGGGTRIIESPFSTIVATLPDSGLMFVSLGGTVAPARTQVPGTYRASVVLEVDYADR